MATIVVAGSRYWQWGEAIATVLDFAPKSTVVVVGGARGADYLAELVCKSELGLHAITIEANWDKYGKRAGSLRNQQMLTYRPKFVVGFHDKPYASRGTRNLFYHAERNNIPHYWITQTWLERRNVGDSWSRFRTSGLEGMVSLMTALRSWQQSNLGL